MSAGDRHAATIDRVHLGRRFAKRAARPGLTANLLRDVCWAAAEAMAAGTTQWEIVNVLQALGAAALKRAQDGRVPSEESPTEVRIHAERAA